MRGPEGFLKKCTKKVESGENRPCPFHSRLNPRMKISRIYEGIRPMLKKSFGLLALTFVLASCGGMPSPSIAAESPNVLIMGVDGGRHMARRNGPVFRTVRESLSNVFFERGYGVYDEAAASLGKVRQHLSHRSDAEIVGIARAVSNPPIDLVVAFSAYTAEKDTRYARKLRVRLQGRLIDIRTGRLLGTAEIKSAAFRHAGNSCRKACLADLAAREAAQLAPGLGEALVAKLGRSVQVEHQVEDDYPLEGEVQSAPARVLKDNAYTLTFNGFGPREMYRIEEYLVSFKGYRDHRPVRTDRRFAEYWYETDIRNGRLNRNLRKMLNRLGMKGQVAMQGNRFVIDRFGPERQGVERSGVGRSRAERYVWRGRS